MGKLKKLVEALDILIDERGTFTKSLKEFKKNDDHYHELKERLNAADLAIEDYLESKIPEIIENKNRLDKEIGSYYKDIKDFLEEESMSVVRAGVKYYRKVASENYDELDDVVTVFQTIKGEE